MVVVVVVVSRSLFLFVRMNGVLQEFVRRGGSGSLAYGAQHSLLVRRQRTSGFDFLGILAGSRHREMKKLRGNTQNALWCRDIWPLLRRYIPLESVQERNLFDGVLYTVPCAAVGATQLVHQKEFFLGMGAPLRLPQTYPYDTHL